MGTGLEGGVVGHQIGRKDAFKDSILEAKTKAKAVKMCPRSVGGVA